MAMTSTQIGTFQNRQHAAYLLSERLIQYKHSDAVIMAIPHGGVPVGYYLAKELHLPLDAIGCKKLEHPGDHNKSIGSVSSDEVIMHEASQSIPQDYLYHQIRMIQISLLKENENYSGLNPHPILKDRTVIVVDDFLKTGDTMLACIKSIKKQQPGKVIIAVPIATPEAIDLLAVAVDEIIYLVMEPEFHRVNKWYDDFPQVSEGTVCILLDAARRQFSLPASHTSAHEGV